jgi:hypothetical protein
MSAIHLYVMELEGDGQSYARGTGCLADAPAQQHIQFHTAPTTYFKQSRHIERLRERYHWHG